MKNRVELRTYIRYQLAQLGARNGEHEFELLCFELARCRHVSNLQPATGPVKAGGDQGRDFESYRTYIIGTDIARSTFVTMASNELVVGACTLNKNTPTKIRADLKVIFGAGNRPDRILYFCEPDVPVAKRHELQRECKTNYESGLEVFDGQAISDHLSDADTFWIAEQYLSVPADFYPNKEIDDAYHDRRDRWLKRRSDPINYADFLDIKIGLRTAVQEEAARPDLLGWLARMREFTTANANVRLMQRARYEIAVAELRGRGNLDPALPYVEAFFENLGADAQLPSDVLDAAVLVIYCWGAFTNGQTSASLENVQQYVDKVASVIDASFAGTSRRGDRCTLLEARAMLAAFPQPGDTHDTILQQSLNAWREVVKAVEEVPFFPIAHIADLVEQFAPAVGDCAAFRALRDDIDRLTDKRAGSHEVADRSRRRALAHLQAGNRLAAIDELQRAKVGSFTGDEMANSILDMLLLSECYADLGLHIASRYYAAGATYIAIHSEDEGVNRLSSAAGFTLAQTFYSSGEGTTFLLSLGQIIGMHLSVAQSPFDLEKHPRFQRALAHASIFKAAAHRLAPHLDNTVNKAVADWPLHKVDVKHVMDLGAAPESAWITMSLPEIEDAIERDLGRSPFSDLGDPIGISWSALGIRWTIRHSADRPTRVAALELAATLQIAQVELADAELLVIPTTALILVETAQVDRPDVQQLPDNGRLAWKAILPSKPSNSGGLDGGFADSLAVATAVIGQATALDREAFQAVIQRSLERGLTLRAFSVRPARELMEFALIQADGADDLRTLKPVELSRPIELLEPPELAWRSAPGPGYSREKAEGFLANRYRRTSEIVRFCLPRLLADQRVSALLFDLKVQGFLDWQILAMVASIAGQYQVEVITGQPFRPSMQQCFLERMSRPERADDPPLDLSLIDESRLAGQAGAMLAATFQTWGLTLNRQTPDLIGMKRLLDVRYRHSTDDIPHPELFPFDERPHAWGCSARDPDAAVKDGTWTGDEGPREPSPPACRPK